MIEIAGGIILAAAALVAIPFVVIGLVRLFPVLMGIGMIVYLVHEAFW